MKCKFSEKDNKGNLSVDCTECKKGINGNKSCASGARIKKGQLGSCFSGDLLEKFEEPTV